MERIDQFAFYTLGKAIGKLEVHKGEVAPDAVFWDMLPAMPLIASLMEGNPAPLGISRGRCEQIKLSLDQIWERHFTKTDEGGKPSIVLPKKDDPPILSWEWGSVTRAISAFETVFSDEMREAPTYRVPERGIFNLGKLVDSAAETFPPDVRPYISEKALAEWNSAGRCLAFNLLSASGFHVARSVEA